jgi:CheY-like chemotaxis protein
MPHDELLDQAQTARGQRLREQVRLVQASDGGLDPPPLQVLVVEDDSELRDLVTLALLDEGYQVVSASHGAEALERVQAYRPDVILLDLHMPIMDGPTFAERYHALPGPHAPIVVFTAGGQAHRWAERIRAAAYVDKPADLWSLADVLRSCAALDEAASCSGPAGHASPRISR